MALRRKWSWGRAGGHLIGGMMPRNFVANIFVGVLCSYTSVLTSSLFAITIDDFSEGNVTLVDTLDFRDQAAQLQTGLSASHTLPTARYLMFNAINPAPYTGTGVARVSVDNSAWKLAGDPGVTAANLFAIYGETRYGLPPMSLNFAAAGATSLLIDFDYTILDPKIANGRFYLDIHLTSANGKSAYIYQLVGASSEPFSVSVPFASFLSYESSFDLHHVTQMTIGTGNGNMDGAFAISAIRTNSLVTALAGDYNADGKVDTADYVAWRNEYPQVDSTAAYQNWRANFGAHAAPAAAAVPEPAAATVIIAACICSILCPIVSRQQNPGYKARQSS